MAENMMCEESVRFTGTVDSMKENIARSQQQQQKVDEEQLAIYKWNNKWKTPLKMCTTCYIKIKVFLIISLVYFFGSSL